MLPTFLDELQLQRASIKQITSTHFFHSVFFSLISIFKHTINHVCSTRIDKQNFFSLNKPKDILIYFNSFKSISVILNLSEQ